ncbi:MAG: hypothetical protein JW834_04745 [Candidatus Diapherotrites archaeon]|nr:hypothetical protein [Candidatus Diapherotrites archaeon]
MRKALISLLLLSLASAQCAYFFYGNGCPHCARAESTIDMLEAKGVEVHRFEVYDNSTNLALLRQYFNAYSVPMAMRGVPVAFTGDYYLVGDSPIINQLESQLREECPSLDARMVSSGLAGEISELERETVSLWLLTGAALVDSINPCAMAVLLILLAALLAAGGRKRALTAGLAFTAALYIAYFLFGLGLFSAIKVSGLSYIFYQAVGILAILIGLANIKDFFWYGCGGFVMEIPRCWRPRLKAILEKATTPIGAFLAGFVVCLFELPCTGGPYLFILGLLAEKSTRDAAIPLLLYYNVVFVVPLLVINGLFYFGYKRIEEMQKWKDERIRHLHLVAGLVMLALGLWVILGV